MKKLFLLGLFAVMALAASAQLNFAVNAPAWTKVATSIRDEGLNIRKSPSATAPRALINQDEIEDFHTSSTGYSYWSTATPRGNIYADMFGGPAPIASERNGWYEIPNIGPKGVSGWVSAKLCRTYAITPIEPATDTAGNSYVKFFTNGMATYAMFIESNEMDGDVTIYIGRLDKGFVVCPYITYIPSYGEGQRNEVVSRGGQLQFLAPSDGIVPDPSFKGLSQKSIDTIIANKTKLPRPRIYFQYSGGISWM